MAKIYARITKGIDITEEQVTRLKKYLIGELKRIDIQDILQKFSLDNERGNEGYVPFEWLCDNLGLTSKECDAIPYENRNDIDL